MTGSSAPLAVGLVGCGNVAFDDHAPAYLALPHLFKVVAVADPSPERRALVGDRLAIPPEGRHPDAMALIGRGDLDVVDICTPPALHLPIVERAAKQRLHVVCEKPLATTPGDAERIAAVVEEAGITFAMLHNYLWFPEHVAIRDLIGAGVVGDPEVIMIDSLGVADNPGAAGYRPAWRHQLDAGGGVLMDLIHLVYLAAAFLGEPIEHVTASVGADVEASVESRALCAFHAGYRTALVNVGWGVGPGGLRVSGRAGRIEVRYRDGGTGPYRPIDLAHVVRADGTVLPIELGTERDTHRITLADFGRAILDGRAPAAGVRDGARAVAATVAAYASAAQGRTVELPLDHSSPIYERGVGGLRDLPLPPWSPVVRGRLFGGVL